MRHQKQNPYHNHTQHPSSNKKAVALHYQEQTDIAPRLKAKGDGLIAEQIISTAKEHDIPIFEDPSLVQLLSTIELDAQIPPELYPVMAELFAMIYQLEKKAEVEKK